MSNTYDKFRGVQAIKTSCYDERSAAFISEGLISQDITHVRINKNIKAAITFNEKEGPDESLVYTFLNDDLLKGDYFIYNGGYYLIYENVKLTDSSLTWKKQKALECNVRITIEQNSYYTYFLSSIRQKTFNTLENDAALLPDQTALIIVPTNSNFSIDTELLIDTKGWKIIDYDSISNNGISYIYLQRTTIDNIVLETIVPEANNILHPMVEYTFETYNGYFDTGTDKINIISRTASWVKFKVPFGINNLTITTHNNLNENIITSYEVIV